MNEWTNEEEEEGEAGFKMNNTMYKRILLHFGWWCYASDIATCFDYIISISKQ